MKAVRRRPSVTVGPGERVLAWAETERGVLAGTRDALYVPEPALEPVGSRRLAWEEIEAADWNAETMVLRVSEVGQWGEQRREHAWTLAAPSRLLQLVRERVNASVVLQRHVPVDGRRGLRVIARRAPRGDRPVEWFFEYDEGVDPTDPDVRQAAAEALATARDDVGPG